MTIEEIEKKTEVKREVAESLYWHCYWLREAPVNSNVNWSLLFRNEQYRLTGQIGDIKCEKERV